MRMRMRMVMMMMMRRRRRHWLVAVPRTRDGRTRACLCQIREEEEGEEALASSIARTREGRTRACLCTCVSSSCLSLANEMHARLWLCPRVCQMCEDKQGGRRQGRKRSSTRNQKVEPVAAAAAGKGGVDVRVYAYMCVLTYDFICVRACVLSRDMAFLRVHLSAPSPSTSACVRARTTRSVRPRVASTACLPQAIVCTCIPAS